MARTILFPNEMPGDWALALLDKSTNEVLFPEEIVDISEECEYPENSRVILSYFLVKEGSVVRITKTYNLNSLSGVHLSYPLSRQGSVQYDRENMIFETWAENCNLTTRKLHDLIACHSPRLYERKAKNRKNIKSRNKI